MKAPAAAAAAGMLAVLVLAGASASADSFTPVTLRITIAPIARRHQPLKVRVAVGADAGVLDVRTAALRIGVKLAGECGGEYASTPGTVLLDRVLNPQPITGHAYSAVATGSGRPASYGVQTVCVFLEEEGDDRQFATDTSNQVDVSKPCTVRAGRYDAARKAMIDAERRRRAAKGPAARARLRLLVAKRSATAKADRRPALKACGPGVPL